MSYVLAGPELAAVAANNLAGTRSTLMAANAAATATTTRAVAPAVGGQHGTPVRLKK
ncbi:PE domain-containing protein [Mycobacterium shinjukuense]|uniref:PE domain-containing protein n=1 Tax=Mycobacterium shinjukuense TaxID=398694 RepID=A0A7I7MQC0_9MYCO|nr:PE domain-containing protein [Mycobacterium shinjukuense]MCV6984955.1 PE domain-containing protein [Mycobacterium shinjukuense]BBX73509.1 hypothetical protein MSHI_14150 [Mycobacterium shinjukuense]